METKKRKKLSRKMVAICTIFAIILSAALGALGFFTYYTNIYDKYEQYIETILNISASVINVEDMQACILSGEKSREYQKTQEELDRIKSNSDVEFIYVIKPLNTDAIDNAMYVWNAVTKEEVEQYGQIDSLGDLSGEGFPQNMAVRFQETMENGQQVAYLSNRSEEFGYVLTGLYPLCQENGQAVALVGVDISMGDIYTNLYQYLLFVVVGTVLIAGVFLILLLRLMNRNVTAPLLRMSESAADFVRQSSENPDPSALQFRDPQVNTEDEIQLLSENLTRMTEKLVEYMGNLKQMTAQQERIVAELNVAATIQQSMLPHTFPIFPERAEFDVYAKMNVAEEMGGSFYDLFLIDKNRLAVVMGEINGKGIPAALLMVITRTLIKNYSQLGYSPDKVFTQTNNQLSENSEGMTTTAFLGIVDLASGLFRYVNAGHCVPLLKHAGKEFENLPTKDCFVLGSMEGIPYWEQSLQLMQGDLLFVCNRGLVDAENREKVAYSREHMQMRLNQVIGEAYELEDIVRMLEEDVMTFLDGAPRQQDIAMLALRYFGS